MRRNLLDHQRLEPRVPVHTLETFSDVLACHFYRLGTIFCRWQRIGQELADVLFGDDDRRLDMRRHPAMIHGLLLDVPELGLVLFNRFIRVRGVPGGTSFVNARGLVGPHARLGAPGCLLDGILVGPL